MVEARTRVFISYHRADLDAAERVRAHLVARGARTWMDRYDVPVGAYWPDEIDRGLAGAGIVLGILSPDAVGSRNVKNEWDWALQNGKQLVLLRTRPCVLPHRYVSVNFLDAEGDRWGPALDEVARLPGDVSPGDAEIPATRYALAGEVSVAYQQFGTGPVDLVWIPGYISHCEHFWRLPAAADHFRRLGRLFRVILFDKRGTGLSDRTAVAEPLEHRMDDVRAVMDACGVGRAVVAGLSEGVPLACLFAATYPDRAQALVLYGGFAAEYRHAGYPWPPTLEERQERIAGELRTLHQTWGTEAHARRLADRFFPSKADDPETVRWFADLLKLGSSPGADVALDRTNLLIDVRDVLPAVRVPTLVFHRTGDRARDAGEGRYLAERIPGATFVELPGDDHVPWVGDQATYLGMLEELAGRIEGGAGPGDDPDSALATVVVAGAPGADPGLLAGAAEPAARRFRGELRNRDDREWVVATFDGPARAVRFAEALGRGAGAPEGIRAGVDAGEVTVRAGRVAGGPVEAARRLAEHAHPGQVLVSGIVRDLAPGSGIAFRPVVGPPGVPAVFEAQPDPTPAG